MMGMIGVKIIEIIKYGVLTDTIGCSYDSPRIYELISEQFHETYITLQDDRNEKLKKIGI